MEASFNVLEVQFFLRLFAALLLVAGTGCRHSTPRFYPLGIYSVSTTNDLAFVRKAGFNTVAGPANKTYLDAARSLGVKVLASPGTSAGKSFDACAARRTVTAYDSHPALWAWYLVDEPDLTQVSPRQVINASLFLKKIPAKKPTALVIYQGATALHYANLTDILMIDRYPIPWLPLANVPQHLRMGRLALGKKKPLVAVIQAFDWSAFPKELPGEKNLRPPTYEELRCMTYCALAQGANGLFYYCFDGGGWRIAEHSEVWEALKKVVAEVTERLPLFQGEPRWWPVVHEFGDPAIRFNEALDSSINSVLLWIGKGNDLVPPGDYILAVNNTAKRHVYRLRMPEAVRVGIQVFGEDRLLPVHHHWITDEFEPYAVHVYGPLPSMSSRIEE